MVKDIIRFFDLDKVKNASKNISIVKKNAIKISKNGANTTINGNLSGFVNSKRTTIKEYSNTTTVSFFRDLFT
ncbi:hypothetical protein KC947_04405 [Candidatus Saccharibacteria bacterium]|nr:hypothetical protein [Candidatus Saccharibacteria bacterium]